MPLSTLMSPSDVGFGRVLAIRAAISIDGTSLVSSGEIGRHNGHTDPLMFAKFVRSHFSHGVTKHWRMVGGIEPSALGPRSVSYSGSWSFERSSTSFNVILRSPSERHRAKLRTKRPFWTRKLAGPIVPVQATVNSASAEVYTSYGV